MQAGADVIQFPLTVGKTYDYKREYSNGYTEYKVEVEAFEKVKTEAGEFEAYRIKMAGWWKNTLRNWSGRAQRTLWFAPELKRVIKDEFFDRRPNGLLFNAWNEVLVKWEPKAALSPALVPVASVSK